MDGLKRTLLPTLEALLPNWRQRVTLFYAVVAGFEAALDRVRELLDTEGVLCAYPLGEADRAFHPERGLYTTTDERLAARNIAQEIGSVLEKGHPLGFGGSEALVTFPWWVPNNTLPIFWKEGIRFRGSEWRPLFPRA